MMRRHLLCSTLVSLLAGCGSNGGADPLSESSALTNVVVDPDLHFTFEMHDQFTENVRRVTMTASRGEASFQLKCGAHGRITTESFLETVICSKEVDVPGTDGDYLFLDFDGTKTPTVYKITMNLSESETTSTSFATELKVLEGTVHHFSETTFFETKIASAGDPNTDPFAMLAWVGKALIPIVDGPKFFDETGAENPIESLSFKIREAQDLQIDVAMGEDGNAFRALTTHPSISKSPGKVSSDIAPQNVIRSRVTTDLLAPPPPVPQDQ